MQYINISPEVHARIILAAAFPFHETGTQLPNGWWTIPIDEEVYAHLEQKMEQLSTQTHDETLRRLLDMPSNIH